MAIPPFIPAFLRPHLGGLFACLLLLSAAAATGATAYNVNVSGNWTTGATWTPSIVGGPTASDSINLNNSPGVERTVTVDGPASTTYTVSSFSYNSSDAVQFRAAANSGLKTLAITGNFSKSGTGILTLASASAAPLNLNVGGTLAINSGLFNFSGSALTVTGNLQLGASSTAGILGLGWGDLTRNVGTGAGEIFLANGGGGFAAFGADRQVNLGTSVSWQTAGFLNFASAKLYLGDDTATHKLTFVSHIDLNDTATSRTRSVVVNNGLAAVDGAISGNLSQSGSGAAGLTKEGTGTLELTGTNAYAGDTRVNSGVLRIAAAGALSASNLRLAGGVIGLGVGDLTRAIGTASGEVRLTADGSGFAAFSGNRLVNLGGSGALITMGSTPFAVANLVLGDVNSAHTLTFANALDLNAATRTFTVQNGAAAIDAVLSGAVSGTGASSTFVKDGAGTLSITSANTYAGGTLISAGTLLVNNSSGSGTGTGAVSIGSAGTLGGSGIITGLVATAGTSSSLAPDRLTLSGGLNASAGATFYFELGTSSDLLSLASGVFTGSSAANGLIFNFSNAGGLLAGVTYTLIDFGSSSGLEVADLFNNSSYVLDSSFGTGGWKINGGNLQVQFAAVPEPSPGWLLATFGLLLLLARRTARRT